MSGFCCVYVWGLICTSKEQGEAIWDIVLHRSAMAVFQEVKFSDISFSDTCIFTVPKSIYPITATITSNVVIINEIFDNQVGVVCKLRVVTCDP